MILTTISRAGDESLAPPVPAIGYTAPTTGRRSLTEQRIEAAIRNTIPAKAPGDRRVLATVLFRLARRLRSIDAVAEAGSVGSLPIVRQWHGRCVEAFAGRRKAGTMPHLETCEAAFLDAWHRALHSPDDATLGRVYAACQDDPIPPKAIGQSGDLAGLARLARRLQALTPGEPVPMPCRELSDVCGLPWERVRLLLRRMVKLGILRRVTTGRYGTGGPFVTGRASTFLYAGD